MNDKVNTEDRTVPTDDAAFQYLWRNLTEMEMGHRGYDEREIEQATRVPCHTDDCEFDWNSYGWECTDENGKSFHPVADELGEVAEFIGRVLQRIPEANR